MSLLSRLKVTVLGLAFLAVTASAGAAREALPAYMPVGSQTSQPIGHHDFCQKRPGECSVETIGTAMVTLTEPLWAELRRVNDHVNETIAPATDEEMFGKPEVWSYPTTEGDCEDYVLLKRRLLIRAGWPAGALLITVVRRPDGDGHAVLTVHTDRGDLVLDNLRTEILVWSETEYIYVKRQSEHHSGRWVSIRDERGDYVGAVRH